MVLHTGLCLSARPARRGRGTGCLKGATVTSHCLCGRVSLCLLDTVYVWGVSASACPDGAIVEGRLLPASGGVMGRALGGVTGQRTPGYLARHLSGLAHWARSSTACWSVYLSVQGTR